MSNLFTHVLLVTNTIRPKDGDSQWLGSGMFVSSVRLPLAFSTITVMTDECETTFSFQYNYCDD